MGKIRAQSLGEGDVIDTSPIFDYFDREGFEYNEDDRDAAQYEDEIVESVEVILDGRVVVITTGSNFYSVPLDHEVDVVNDNPEGD